jgi:hypothetical protein
MPEVIAKDEFVKNMKHIIHHGIRNMNMKSNMAAVLPEYYPGADPAEAVGLLMPLNFEMSQLHSHNQVKNVDIKQRNRKPHIVSPTEYSIPKNGEIKISVDELDKIQHYENVKKITPLNDIIIEPYIMYTINSDMIPSSHNGTRGFDPNNQTS